MAIFMQKKIQEFIRRLSEVEAALSHPDAFSDPKKYRELTQEHAYLNEVRLLNSQIENSKKQLADNQAAIKTETDASFIEMLKEDSESIEKALPELEKKLEILLVPPDPNDSRNTILELRAGTGGDEAAIFVGDCVRMYRLFSDKMGWKTELISCAESEMGGFKEYIMSVVGTNVYRFLRYEGGTHRVQRVPETEAQGRVHTSAITVAVLLEPDENTDIKIDERDLRVDTYRSSGAGGQHVNTTDSAVRLTHVPTGIVVYCQQERSQHKNKEKAMRLLLAKMAEVEAEKKAKEMSSSRSEQVGSGDRSERIRTYNYPQNRVTDHRINLTKYNLDQVMAGELDEFANALVTFYHQEKLAE